MKKTSIALAVVAGLAVAYTGASWYMGKEAQKAITVAVSESNQQMAKSLGTDISSDQAVLSIDSYDRGVFSSLVTYTLTLRDGSQTPIVLRLEDQLSHGPFPWVAVRGGDVSPLLAYSQARLLPTPSVQPWFDAVKDGAPMTVRTRLELSRDGISEWHFAPAALQRDGAEMDFSGGSILVDFADEFTSANGTGRFASLNYKDETGSVQLRDMTLFSKTRRQQDVNQSEGRVDIGQVQIASEDDGKVSLERFAIEFAAEQQGNLVDADLRYLVGKLNLGDKDLGELTLGLKAQRLDVNALTAISQTLDSVNAEAVDSDSLDEALTDAQMQALAQHWQTMLKSEPRFALDAFQWKNAEGESSIALKTEWAEPTEAQVQALAYLETPGLETLRQAELDVQLHRGMLLRLAGELYGDMGTQLGAMIFDEFIDNLRLAGVAVVDGDKAGAKAVYRGQDATVDLNGQNMPLEDFVALVMELIP